MLLEQFAGLGATLARTLLLRLSEEREVVHVATEDALTVVSVHLGEQDVGVPHLVDVTEWRNLLAWLEYGELQEMTVLYLRRVGTFPAPVLGELELRLDFGEIEQVDLCQRISAHLDPAG